METYRTTDCWKSSHQTNRPERSLNEQLELLKTFRANVFSGNEVEEEVDEGCDPEYRPYQSTAKNL